MGNNHFFFYKKCIFCVIWQQLLPLRTAGCVMHWITWPTPTRPTAPCCETERNVVWTSLSLLFTGGSASLWVGLFSTPSIDRWARSFSIKSEISIKKNYLKIRGFGLLKIRCLQIIRIHPLGVIHVPLTFSKIYFSVPKMWIEGLTGQEGHI